MSALTWTVQKHSWSFTEKLVEQLCQRINLSMSGNPKVLFQLIHNNLQVDPSGEVISSGAAGWFDLTSVRLFLNRYAETFHYFLSLCCVLKYSTSRNSDSAAEEPRQSLSGGLLSLFDPPLITFLIIMSFFIDHLSLEKKGIPLRALTVKNVETHFLLVLL